MKNTLTVKVGDTKNPCSCECLDSVYDGGNSICLALDVPNDDTNPKIELYEVDKSSGTLPLLQGQQTIKLVDDEGFDSWKNTQMRFRYVSNERTGLMFRITFPQNIEGNLMLKRVDDYGWNAQFTDHNNQNDDWEEYKLPPATTTTLGGVIVGENIEVESDGTISCKKITALQEDMEELFQSVSNGKKEIASAITDKGVSTESDATFSQMAENISKIETGGSGGSSEGMTYLDLSDCTVIGCTGIEFNELIKTLANDGYSKTYTEVDNYVLGFSFETSSSTSGEQIKTLENFPYLYADTIWNDDLVGYYIVFKTTAKKIIAPIDCDYMFSGFCHIQDEQDFSWLDTRFSVTMNSMFNGFGRDYMTKLSLGSSFYVGNAWGTANMFNWCGKVAMTELNLGNNFDTGNVESMDSMFLSAGYNNMTSLDLGSTFKIKKSDVIGPGGNLFNRNEYYPLTVYCTQDTADQLAGISYVTPVVKY